jgi:hypothetical protein
VALARRRFELWADFLTLSGVYLWIALRAERRIGLTLLSLGALSFFGLIYAVTA